jgi:hypothetical protein
MKDLNILLVCFLLLLCVVSCHRNRLKVDEKELTEKILQEENQKEAAIKAAYEKNKSDTTNRIPSGFRYNEDRSVDPHYPPAVIDIAGNLNNAKEIKLSDIASDIKYIRMQPVPDPKIPSDLKFSYYLLDNYIVAVNLYGIHLYSKAGKYIRPVVKNELTGVEVRDGNIHFWSDYTLKGGGLSVWGEGNKLFYKYSDNITGHKYIMEYDCSSDKLMATNRFDPESPYQITGLGKAVIDLNHGKIQPPKPRKHQGMFGGQPEGFFLEEDVFMLNQNAYTSPHMRDDKGDNTSIMTILNSNGDTLTAFTRFEKLTNYTRSLQRGTDYGTQYDINGKLFFRPRFNDTVFIVIPPNRILPVYVLRLGSYKVSMQQGIDPGFKLTGKIIPGDWAETKDYIFLTFTKDDYDCPNTRKNKTVKIYHAVYSKHDEQLSVIKGDPYDYSPEILENDLDGGVPVWPLSYMVGNNGEIMIPLKGRDLKERIASPVFKNCAAPEAQKKQLEKLAGSVSETNDILMLIK